MPMRAPQDRNDAKAETLRDTFGFDAFRPGQRVTVTSLQDLEREADSVDMVTIVVIGNSTTYLHGRRSIPPRSYEEKAKAN